MPIFPPAKGTPGIAAVSEFQSVILDCLACTISDNPLLPHHLRRYEKRRWNIAGAGDHLWPRWADPADVGPSVARGRSRNLTELRADRPLRRFARTNLAHEHAPRGG